MCCFSGVNWERKGAAIAIDTVKKLINTGINAKLLLVGIKLDDIPANYRNLPWVEYFGFMNKNMPEQYQRYVDAIKKISPTVVAHIGGMFCYCILRGSRLWFASVHL